MERSSRRSVVFSLAAWLLATPAIFVATPITADQSAGWVVTYSYAGSDSVVLPSYTMVMPWNFYTSPGATPTHYYMWNGPTVEVTSSGVIHARCRWLNAGGSPAPNPPGYQWFNRYSDVEYSVLGTSRTGTASDGLSDPTIATDGPRWLETHGICSGHSLVRLDTSGGDVTLDIPVSVDARASSPSGAQASFAWRVGVSPDPRGALVSSTIDPTYRRSVVGATPVREANLRAPDGTMGGDTLYSTVGCNYLAVPQGTWGLLSNYHWYSSLTNSWGAGLWSPLPPGALTVAYDTVAAPGDTDHIHLRLVDSGDGAYATANYYMHLHDRFEDWVTTQSVAHPSGPAGSADWTLVGEVSNPDGDTIQRDVPVSLSIHKVETCSVGGVTITPASDAPGYESVRRHTGISSPTTVDCTANGAVSVPVPPHSRIRVYAAPVWTELAGTCSIWGITGYECDAAWFGARVPNSNGIAGLAISTATDPL